MFNIGTSNYLKAVDPNLWYGAFSSQASQPPPMYTPDFYSVCIDMVRHEFDIDLNRDINISNCLDVYNFLVGTFE